ncbi:hypothetical protein JX265_010783 [Neoarthrinium moseri]|uniref:Cytochrome P450 n=1 Tax=Neoarthrinium moseri TaxID=1658444 RepID=A0A9P9WDK5_9PEZI|nr:uncharacterized protein JN550_010651 [Neoarthrinium moseri]KAI1840221.1 hypothetical protein JX266_013588 [Neoarthrinium moseri]KAI1858115.1 hypothetical protein JX265_010783 [Neoarthrinium moseri]KAI1862020.1 hypothetical protein JN550_010651 [Neoarthrinium moseri]
MAHLDLLVSYGAPLFVFATIFYYLLAPYFFTYGKLRNIPGPFLAKFSRVWLLYVSRWGHRAERVDELHKKWGPVVRIQPNQFSIADDEAIPVIYGHKNGFPKSDYYDAFISMKPGIFSTRDKAVHVAKRKRVAHVFAPKSLGQFEPYIHSNLAILVRQLDSITMNQRKPDGWAYLDCLPWFNFTAFDIIGDLAFGGSFGMLESGADIAEYRPSPEAPPLYTRAVETLNRRGDTANTLGALPELRHYAKWLPDPFFRHGSQAIKNLTGIAIARVKNRLENPLKNNREDILQRLIEARDDNGQPLAFSELVTEALSQLVAGSDTTSNSGCALLYHVGRTPGILPKLQKELDAAIPDDVEVPSYNMVSKLPYLEAVINETLRLHSTAGLGLPREIPATSSGVDLHGHHFPPGTILSVPIYTIHHSKKIWGSDVADFKPERWFSLTDRQKAAFIPFGSGTRACVGRNLAELEMKVIIATWAKRYDFVTKQDHLETFEGFLRKPLGLQISLRRRKL